MILDVFPRLRSRGVVYWGLLACSLISALTIMPGSESHASDFTGVAPVLVDLSAYEGHWQRTEAVETDAARESAIKEAVSGLSWIMRTMASGVLRRTTAPPPEMQFAWDGARLHQGFSSKNGGFSRIIELGGELITRKDQRGVDFDSSWTWTEAGLRLRWEQHQADGNNLYRLDENAGTLTVQHMIHITAISNVDPILFVSRFLRTDRPARAADGLDDVARVSVD